VARAAYGIEFEGLEELTKSCEDLASVSELAATNKRVVERGLPVLKENMKRRIPVSVDNSKSGRKSSRPPGHAKDHVPVSAIKTNLTAASAEVGWKLSDTSSYFYMKFVNWGTTKQPPREFVHSAAEASQAEIIGIAREEYEKLLKTKIGV
jgi:HK97 gp10 family phage protein